MAPPSASASLLTRFTSVFSSPLGAVRCKGYKMKTHKGAAARWHKTKAGNFKHGAVTSNHGNTGWSKSIRSRGHTGGYALGPGHGNHIKRIRRILPNA
ncbi:uncharacterized protein V1518DRAFT_377385 [Limtongia smithiae]|uniref:uncharacterized protein n=1 Tax=Limtongia smithiae TaxID=1125753 RepID=UPI0034CF21E9